MRPPPEHLDALERIGEVGQGSGINVDLSGAAGIDRLFEAADGYLGALDVIVISAAVRVEATADTSERETRYQLETHLTVYVVTAQEAVKRMGPGRNIVFIESMSVVSHSAGSSIYVATKADVEGLAVSLLEGLAENDIKVGMIESAFTGARFHYPDYLLEKQCDLIHQNRMLPRKTSRSLPISCWRSLGVRQCHSSGWRRD